MFLRTLVLRGFKSFADKTVLELEPGITVVVGPNGSGKSNIVDAISWVLGEQGPRALRGGRMEDVIFAGSRLRPALAVAEVSLTIDNSAKLLPVEFSEVTIARALFRSGESEYRMNGAPCRLLDLQELLSDTGIGREQHTIIGQGQLDAILTADHMALRGFIEEAAGVAKHRRRRERALRRISGAEANIARVSDLLSEVRRRLRPLREQAEVAKRHAALAGELSRLRFVQTARELAGVRARLGPGGAVDLDAPIRGHEDRLRAVEQELADAEMRRMAAAERSYRCREAAWALGSVGERLAALARLADERGRTFAAEMASYSDDRGRARVEAIERELAEAGLQLEEAAQREGRASEEAAALRSALDAAEKAIGESQGRLDPLLASHREAVSAEVRLRGDLSSMRTSLASAESEHTRLQRRAEAIACARDEAEKRLDEARRSLESLEAAEAPLAASLAEAEAEVGGLAETREAALAALHAAEREVAARAATVQARLEGSPKEAHRVADLGLEGVIGVLDDLVDADPEHRAALEAVAGPVGGVLIVEDTAAAERVLDAAGQERSVVILIARQAPGMDPGSLPLSDAIRARHPAVHAALSGVYLAPGPSEAAQRAEAHPALTYVTRDGGLASGRLLVSVPPDPAARAGEAERLRGEAAATLSAVEQRTAEAERRRADAAARLNDLDAALEAASEAMTSIERDLHGLEREQRAVEEATQRAASSEVVLRGRIEDAERALPGATAAIERVAVDLEHLQEEHSSARGRLEAAGAAYDAVRLEAARASERRRMSAERREALAADLERARRHAAALAGRRAKLARAAQVAGSVAQTSAALRGAVSGWLAEANDAVATARESATAGEQAVAALRARRAEAAAALEELRERAREEDLERTELRVRGRILEERLGEEWQAEPGDAVERWGHPWEVENLARLTDPLERTAATDDETLGRRRAKLERDLAAMGRVNPLAAQELDDLTEREDYLSSQLGDLRSSRRDLFKVVASVDEEIRTLFGAAFADVAREYDALFALLFPGGQGRLRLTEPGELLTTGVEVEARPGGKNLKRLSLLSGGERALAALAFLFAIFRARPSPFYVLDEVEAALDDINLQRFLRLLHAFRETSQLLVVTHQKRTMEVADVLYGVSVRPDGASRVISQRLADVPVPLEGARGHARAEG